MMLLIIIASPVVTRVIAVVAIGIATTFIIIIIFEVSVIVIFRVGFIRIIIFIILR